MHRLSCWFWCIRMGHVFTHSPWFSGLYFAIFLLGPSLLIIIQMKKCHLRKIRVQQCWWRSITRKQNSERTSKAWICWCNMNEHVKDMSVAFLFLHAFWIRSWQNLLTWEFAPLLSCYQRFTWVELNLAESGKQLPRDKRWGTCSGEHYQAKNWFLLGAGDKVNFSTRQKFWFKPI